MEVAKKRPADFENASHSFSHASQVSKKHSNGFRVHPSRSFSHALARTYPELWLNNSSQSAVGTPSHVARKTVDRTIARCGLSQNGDGCVKAKGIAFDVTTQVDQIVFA